MANTDETKSGIIKDASYYVYEGWPRKDSPIEMAPIGIRSGTKMVTFYTFNGDHIITIDHKWQDMNMRLDHSAPKPKLKSFKKIWWPGIRIGEGYTKGKPGYGVYFHDKNDNRIGWERIATPDKEIKTMQYDFSEAIEEPTDFSQMDDVPHLYPMQNEDTSTSSSCIIL